MHQGTSIGTAGVSRLALLLVALALGCEQGDPPRGPTGQVPPASPADGAQAVVARVGDRVIGLADVQRYMATHRMGPRDALRALESEALLAQEAVRRGWQAAGGQTAELAEERLLAQRVLLDIERAHPTDGPSEAEVDAYLAEHLAEIVREEQRDCVQVMVEVPAGATDEQHQLAQTYVESTLERMRREGVESVWSSQPPEHEGLRVQSQYLPPATASTEMPDEFRRAIFGVSTPGAAAEAVRTPTGWHAVGVTQIHAPIAADSAEAREVARERLVTARRRDALGALLQTLSQRYPISVERAQVEVILPLLGGSSGSGT
jgi:hypothetical protein